MNILGRYVVFTKNNCRKHRVVPCFTCIMMYSCTSYSCMNYDVWCMGIGVSLRPSKASAWTKKLKMIHFYIHKKKKTKNKPIQFQFLIFRGQFIITYSTVNLAKNCSIILLICILYFHTLLLLFSSYKLTSCH